MEAFDHDDIIQVQDLDARIAYLTDTDDRSEYEDEELQDLKRFRDKIANRIGDDTTSLVSDAYWQRYADDRAEDLYGEAVKTIYWNDEHWALDLRADYKRVRWNGEIYWGDGS